MCASTMPEIQRGLWFHYCICLHSSCISWHFTLCLRKAFLLANIFQSLYFIPSPLTSLPVLLSFLSPTLHLSFSINFLRHSVNLFSDMPNSCSVSPWLVSPLVLSSNRTFPVSYVHHIILFPKNLTCTDWTTQSRVQVVLTDLPRCTHLQSS